MHIKFINPGFEYMLNSIIEFQKDDASSFWNGSLFYFFKELDKEYAYSLLPEKRREYFKEKMLEIYKANEKLLEGKIQAYSRYWNLHREEIEQAFSDAFEVDCSNLFNDLVCKISLNPISPRYLKEHTFDSRKYEGGVGRHLFSDVSLEAGAFCYAFYVRLSVSAVKGSNEKVTNNMILHTVYIKISGVRVMRQKLPKE